MEKRTAEIIMVLKGNHDLGEFDTLKQALAGYMSDRCDYPADEYSDEMLFGIVREAVMDYLYTCVDGGQKRAFMYHYFDAHKWHDDLECWLAALQMVQVREKNKDGSYTYINGFTEENTAFVYSDAAKRKQRKLQSRCEKCVYETSCMNKRDAENCKKYKRNAPDGGYYG